MNILYIITILAVYILLILFKKTDKKQNILEWLGLSAILIICYNTFICIILTFFGQLCTLQNLSICNIIVIIALLALILKNKKIQKYYIKILDIVFCLIFLMIIIFMAYKQYGFPFNVKYKITDGSTHYYYAEQFYETSTLLYKGENNELFGLHDSDFRLPGAYVNEGILFKVFENVIEKIDVFVVFDLFILYSSGILFYCLLKKYIAKEKKLLQILAAVFAIIYALGYQLNSILYGFVYFSLALDIIVAFLLMMYNYEKREIARQIALPILSILSFGIFFSYTYFIPIIYIAILVKMMAKYIINEETFLSQENILTIIWTIINPLILGITYFVILPKMKGIENEISTIIKNGRNYKNVITNLLAFIPIYITGIVLAIKNKNKKCNFATIAFIISILYLLILFSGNKLNMISEYYCYKAYYIIWILAIYVAFKIICNCIENKNKALKIGTIAYIGAYVLILIIPTIMLKNVGINAIFQHNVDVIKNEKYLVAREHLQLAEVVKSTLESSETYFFSSRYEGRAKWIGVLSNELMIIEDIEQQEIITIERWLAEKQEKYYAAYELDYNQLGLQVNLDSNSEQYKILYQNEYGFILERK